LTDSLELHTIDALLGAMVKHKCELVVFLSIKEPAKPMPETIATSGIIETPGSYYRTIFYNLLFLL
jgi:hypothetical protein